MASVPYEVAQGKTLYISNPMVVAAIGGDNATPFYLNFPQLPPGMQWVFPYTYNFMYPIDPPQQLRIDASKIPRGYPVVPTSSEVALLTAWDTPQPYSAGVRTAASPPSTQSIATGTILLVNDAVTIPCGGSSFVGIAIKASSILVGTALYAEATVNDVDWSGLPVFDPANSRWISAAAAALSGSGIGGVNPEYFIAPTGGFSQARIRAGNIAGGQTALTVLLRATPGSDIAQPSGQQISDYSMPVVLAADQKPPNFRNRVEFAATALTIATVAVEAMLILVPVRAGVAGAGVTSIAVTAGKRLRLHTMLGEFRNNAAAVHLDQFTLKTNPGGATVVASPSLARIECYAPAALANTGQQQSASFGDGIEFAGTDQIGVSHLSDAAAIGFGTVSLIGIEYTP